MTVTNVQLPGDGRSAIEKIATKAARHGTFCSPTDGQILYVDPDHADERHHSPKLTREEAAYAFERGLIEDPAKAKVVTETEDGPADAHSIAKVGAERTADFAKQDDEGGTGSGTLDSRQSTAWPDRGRVEGGVEGYAHGIPPQTGGTLGGSVPAVDTESGDADAPPAPQPRAARPARPTR